MSTEIKRDYGHMTNAYKALQDSLLLHINNIHTLSKNQIESTLTLVRSTLDILEKKAYEVYDELPEMTKHILDEKDYRRTMKALEYKYWGDNTKNTLVKKEDDYAEHLAWKAERVKYLQELFPNKHGTFGHTEEWFVKNNLMYDESI